MQKIWLGLGGKAIAYHLPYFLYTRRRGQFKAFNKKIMEWIYRSDNPIFQTLTGCVIIFVAIIMLTRIVGLRAFAKITAYDFAFTVVIGSIISSTLTSSPSLANGSIAIVGFLIIMFAFSTLQRKSPFLSKIISNTPLLLVDGNKILHDTLKSTRIEEEQLISKLRETNVLNYDQVFAVILESIDDISVMQASHREKHERFDKILLKGVRTKPLINRLN